MTICALSRQVRLLRTVYCIFVVRVPVCVFFCVSAVAHTACCYACVYLLEHHTVVVTFAWAR